MCSHPQKIGVLCSAGGSSFFSAAEVLIAAGTHNPDDFLVITDRECGAEDQARRHHIRHIRVVEDNRQLFSIKVSETLKSEGCTALIMLFSRLVSSELFSTLLTLNIHPALLPSFKGMNAVKQAYNQKIRFQGSTLHVANEDLDAGPIVSQVITPINHKASIDYMERISYVQKAYLVLVAIDLLMHGVFETDSAFRSLIWKKTPRQTWAASPAVMTESIITEFSRFQNELGIKAILP